MFAILLSLIVSIKRLFSLLILNVPFLGNETICFLQKELLKLQIGLATIW